MKNYCALITSFDEFGNLDEVGFKNIIRFVTERSKVDGFFVNGTGGENYILDLETKKRIFKIVKENADGFLLIAQIGCNNFHEVIELSQYVYELGYDAVSILTPQYLNTSFLEVYNYFEIITAQIKLPVYIYYFPSLNQIYLNVSEFNKLLELQNVIGVKYTATDLKLGERIKRYNPKKEIYIGYDEFVTTCLLLGMDGAVGVSFNILGKPIETLKGYILKNDFANAQIIQSYINDFLENIKGQINQNMRMIMNYYGYECKYSKLPLTQEVPLDLDLISSYELLLRQVQLP